MNYPLLKKSLIQDPSKYTTSSFGAGFECFCREREYNREARAAEVAEAYGMSVRDVLEQLEKYRTK